MRKKGDPRLQRGSRGRVEFLVRICMETGVMIHTSVMGYATLEGKVRKPHVFDPNSPHSCSC